LSPSPKGSPLALQHKKKGKAPAHHPATPPLSPDNVNVEQEKRDQEAAEDQSSASKPKTPANTPTATKKKDQLCVFRLLNYSITPSNTRGKIGRVEYYKLVSLVEKTEEKKTILLTEGSQVKEYKTEAWHHVLLIHKVANSNHIQLILSPVANPTADMLHASLESILEIQPSVNWDTARSDTHFSSLLHESAKAKAAKKPVPQEATHEEGSTMSTLRKADREMLASMSMKVNDLIAAQHEIVEAIHALCEQLAEYKRECVDMLHNLTLNHPKDIIEALKATREINPK
jgi:hypothetical protein